MAVPDHEKLTEWSDESKLNKLKIAPEVFQEILLFFETYLENQWISEPDIKVITEAVKSENNEDISEDLELLRVLTETWYELDDSIYKFSIKPKLEEAYVNSIENNWPLSKYWNLQVLDTWSDQDIYWEKRNMIETLLTILLKKINEEPSLLSDYNLDKEYTQNLVKSLKHIRDVLNDRSYKPVRFLYTDRKFSTMRDYIEHKELIRIIEVLLEKLKNRWNIEESSPNDNENDEIYIEEQNSKLNDYLTLLDIIYFDFSRGEMDREYFNGEIKKLKWGIESLMEALSERKGKIRRDLFNKIIRYPDFYEIIIDNIWVFDINTQDLEDFVASLLKVNRLTEQKKAKILEYLMKKIDNFRWLDNAKLHDLYYMELYFAFYPIEVLGDNAPNDYLDDRIKYCIKNLKNMERERGYLEWEFKDFVNLLKTTKYRTPENRKACYREAKRRGEIEFIFDNYALWYFTEEEVTEKALFDLSPKYTLYNLPLFTDSEVISTIKSLLSERGKQFFQSYSKDEQEIDEQFSQDYFRKECLENNRICFQLMKNRMDLSERKKWRIKTGKKNDD